MRRDIRPFVFRIQSLINKVESQFCRNPPLLIAVLIAAYYLNGAFIFALADMAILAQADDTICQFSFYKSQRELWNPHRGIDARFFKGLNRSHQQRCKLGWKELQILKDLLFQLNVHHVLKNLRAQVAQRIAKAPHAFSKV